MIIAAFSRIDKNIKKGSGKLPIATVIVFFKPLK